MKRSHTDRYYDDEYDSYRSSKRHYSDNDYYRYDSYHREQRNHYDSRLDRYGSERDYYYQTDSRLFRDELLRDSRKFDDIYQYKPSLSSVRIVEEPQKQLEVFVEMKHVAQFTNAQLVTDIIQQRTGVRVLKCVPISHRGDRISHIKYFVGSERDRKKVIDELHGFEMPGGPIEAYESQHQRRDDLFKSIDNATTWFHDPKDIRSEITTAGILLTFCDTTTGTRYLLLSEQFKHETRAFSTLMGKKKIFPTKQKDESPVHTAVREFNEETYHYFDSNQGHADKNEQFGNLISLLLRKKVQGKLESIYAPHGMIKLYVVDLADIVEKPSMETCKKIVQELNAMVDNSTFVSQDHGKDKTLIDLGKLSAKESYRFEWVECDLLMKLVPENPKLVTENVHLRDDIYIQKFFMELMSKRRVLFEHYLLK